MNKEVTAAWKKYALTLTLLHNLEVEMRLRKDCNHLLSNEMYIGRESLIKEIENQRAILLALGENFDG